jgi:hypothetical protein
MRYSAALPSHVYHSAKQHLLRPDRQEDLCFALWSPSVGTDRTTALIRDIILPRPGERRVHGNASFEPQYFERAVSEALRNNSGLAFMHSHLGPGWQDMSRDDIEAEKRLAPRAKGATSLPIVGLTLGTDGAWSARFWEKVGPKRFERQWCECTRVVGERLAVTYEDRILPPPRFRPELSRTVSAWGTDAQATLARLKIGVIGAGSVGFIVAEALARMGVANIRLMDFDAVEIHNLDRLLYASHRDVHIAKVSVLGRALRRSATASPFTVDELEYSVVEENGFRAALDCDVLFSCVDRPWPRSALNLIAYAHLIPVIDGGVAVRMKSNGRGLSHADIRSHVAAPSRRCLECLGQYSPGLVSTEREGYLDDPHYIAGLPDDHPIKRNENVFAFGLSAASLEVFQLLSMVIAPLGMGNPGAQMYHFVNGRMDIEAKSECDSTCVFPKMLAMGDRAGVEVTAPHRIASDARTQRRRWSAGWRKFLWSFYR